MESGIQSSFIPRDAGEVKISAPRLGGGGAGFADLMLLLSIVLLVASIALGGGVFLYKQYLQTSTNSKIEQLQRAKAAFEPSLIQQLTRLDDRMHAVSAILSAHIAPSVFFGALEQSTLATVSFRSLDYNLSDAQNINIKMEGLAQSVNSVALQAQLFSKNGVISSPIFSGISREAEGVRFSLGALINPAGINYSHSLLNATPTSGQQTAPQQAQPVQKQPSSPFGGTAPVNPEN